jgi:hypothetical protein
MTKPYKDWEDAELYAHAKEFLLKQGKKATAGDGHAGCVYLAPDGCRCGAGLFLKDKVPDDEIRALGSKGINDPSVASYFERAGFSKKQIDGVLVGVQYAHDCYRPTKWPKVFENMKVSSDARIRSDL